MSMNRFKRQSSQGGPQSEAKPEAPVSAPTPTPPKSAPKVTRPGKLSISLPRPYGWMELTFETQERLRNWDCPEGLDNWAFRLGDMPYKNHRDLFRGQIKEVSKDIAVFRDVHGRRFLRVYIDRPTFDSGDREWDSYIWYGIMPHSGDVEVLMVNGGYSIGVIEIYRRLTDGREAIEALLEQSGLT